MKQKSQSQLGYIPVGEEDLRKILFLIYRASHISMYFSSKKILQKEYWTRQVAGTYQQAVHHSTWRKDLKYGRSRTDQSIVSQLILETLDMNEIESINPWLLPRRIERNNCDNFAPLNQGLYKNTKEMSISMSDMYRLAKEDVGSGACFSCSKDRNSFSRAAHLSTYNSSVFRSPTCSRIIDHTGGFEVHMLATDRVSFKIGKILVDKKAGAILEGTIGEMYQENKKKAEYLKGLIHVKEELNGFKIRFHHAGKTEKEGLLHQIEASGYKIRFQIPSSETNLVKRSFNEPLLSLFTLKQCIETSCNPIYFPDIETLHSPPSATLPKASNHSRWPIQYIAAHKSKIRELNKQASFHDASTKDVLQNTIFLETEIGEPKHQMLSIAEIRFWS